MLDLVIKNKEWIFSGAGVTAVMFLFVFGRRVMQWARPQSPTVRVAATLAGNPLIGMAEVLTIKVQNRTDKAVYVGNLFLELDSRQQFMPLLDALTRRGQDVQKLQPGTSTSFNILVSDIRESGIPRAAFRCAAFRDGTDQVYRSSTRELQNVLTFLNV
jgi:hypothetical protein